MKRSYLPAITAGILLVAATLRTFGMPTESFWMDESFSIALAQAIADHGYPLLDSGFVIWRDPFYHYILAFIVTLFGTGEIAVRLFSVFIGTATVAALGFIASKWFSRRVGIIVMLLAATSYWEIAWSRQARMYILLQLLFWVALYLFTRWQEQWKNKNNAAFFVIAAVATIGTHLFGALLIPVCVWYAVLRRHSLETTRRKFLFAASFVAGILFTIVAAVIVIRLFTGQHVFVNYWSHYISYIGTTQWATLILAAIGVVAGLRKANTTMPLWLCSTALVGLGIYSYGVPLLQYRYLFFLWPAALMLTALGIELLMQKSRYLLIVTVTLLLFSQEYLLMPQRHILLESDAAEGRTGYKSFTPQPDFRSAYEIINAQSPAVLITPYPTITRLYTNRQDTYSIFVDLTGLDNDTQTHERYTGTPLLTVEQLKVLKHNEMHGILLLDYFSQRRMNDDVRAFILKHTEPVHELPAGPWSAIQLFSF